MRGDIGRWRAWPTRALPWRCWPWRVSGCIRWRAGNGGCSRRFASGRGSRRSAAWRSGTASASRGLMPAWSSGSSRPPSPASRSSWFCGSISGSSTWFAPTPWLGSSPKVWSVPRSSNCRPAGPTRPLLAELDTIASEPPLEINDLLKKAASSLARLDAATDAAERGLGELNAIAGSIRRGEGSLGKLIRDDAAYQSLLDLSHRGERSLTALDENLTAAERDLAAIALLRPPRLSRP